VYVTVVEVLEAERRGPEPGTASPN
jgi:hypothetical protein